MTDAPNRHASQPVLVSDHHSAGVGKSEIVDYYRQTIEDYELWSPQGYMHFGRWRPWLNPFNRCSMLEAMNDLVFESLQLSQDAAATVADLGCGLGAVTRYGCQRFPQHRWRAVTVCQEQVDYAQSRLTENQRQRVEVLRADYGNLPDADESLDAAFFLESLCHADEVRIPLAEAWRVLKPGGRLVVVDGLMRQSAERTSPAIRWLAKTVAENWAVGEFNTLPDFEAQAADLGFVNRTTRELGWQIVPCVAHSPLLVSVHSLRLMAQGRWTAWKRKHMIACGLGVLLGAMRHQFGYYLHSFVKPE